jgi:NAD(P)-dependent dehydrogenase (short-subunit alcohol dehydrogenase family)
MQIDFTDKRVLVTGGSRGIGRGTVAAFLEAGARVAVNGRTARSTAAGIAAIVAGGAGGDSAKLLAAPGDVATVAGCEAAVGAALEGFGGLDVLVNNAGIGKGGSIEDFDEAAWDETLDVNLKGTFFCIRAALAALRASKGNIVNVASDDGLMGQVGLAVYCASKGGVVNMTRAMALELAPDVRINCVCPGYIETDMVRDYIEQSDDPRRRRAGGHRLRAAETHSDAWRGRHGHRLSGLGRCALHHRVGPPDRWRLDGRPLNNSMSQPWTGARRSRTALVLPRSRATGTWALDPCPRSCARGCRALAVAGAPNRARGRCGGRRRRHRP